MGYLLNKKNIFLSSDPFDYISNNSSVSNSSTYNNTAASLYQLFMAIGIIGLMSSIIIAGIKLALIKDANKRAEVKSEIMTKMFHGVLLFGFTFFAGLVLTITKTLH